MPFRVAPEKTIIPDPPAGVLPRSGLADRVDPAKRRVTAFVGPGGFGKTTLLADCCRRAQARGDRVIWLWVDEQDDAQRVVAHLAYAVDIPWSIGDATLGPWLDAEDRYLDALLDAIRADERRWLLAVDELERIPDSGARIIDRLVWRGPANLHLAFACRHLLPAIDIATPVAEGRGLVVGTDELRFTQAEAGDFLGDAMPRQKLNTLWDESDGWPIAVCLQRNLTTLGREELADLSLNWVAARLMRGLTEGDRRFLLEAACFDWVDARMFDEVLGPRSAERLGRIPLLRGLVQEVDGGTSFRLHPLIHRHAESQLRLLGDDHGFRRRVARALARRGRTIDALAQALEANDGDLAAEIFEDAGAVRLVLRDGVRGLQRAVSLLPEHVLERFPRCRLARFAVDSIDNGPGRGKPDAGHPIHATGNGAGHRTEDYEQRVDSLVVRGLYLMCGCAQIGSDESRSTMEDSFRVMAERQLEPMAAGGFFYGHAVFRYETGDLAGALASVQQVRELAHACPSAVLSARMLEGAILFARGDVQESESALMAARRTAQRDFAGHESPELICDTFRAEVALETNRITVADRLVPPLEGLASVGAWLDVYAAAVDVRSELAFRRNAPDRALTILRDASAFARSRSLPAFSRWLAAVHVSALVKVGDVDEANRLWRREAFPTDTGTQVGLEQQSWREMEAVCTARVRLLVAAGDYGAALKLGRAFAASARDCRLARSESWATALAMHAAWLAGDVAAARELLVANLTLTRQTGFTRALAAHPEATVAVLEGLDSLAPHLGATAEDVLATLGIVGGVRVAEQIDWSARELDILTRLPARNKEIARSLGLTEDGVRYHLKRIFAKLGVSDRRSAAKKARLLSPPPD